VRSAIKQQVVVLLLMLLFLGGSSQSISADVAQLNVDQMIFGSLPSDSARRKCLESLEAQISLIEQAIAVRPELRQTWVQAGEIDIHRFFEACAARKQGFKFNVSQDEPNAIMARAALEVGELKERYEAGLHGDGSLFEKVVASTLEPNDRVTLQQFLDVRRTAQYRAYILATLTLLDRLVPLTIEQKDRITKLLLEKTEPPQNFGSGSDSLQVVLACMWQIEAELQVVFLPNEWEVVRPLIESSKQAVQLR
jgi:hypothetical protein